MLCGSLVCCDLAASVISSRYCQPGSRLLSWPRLLSKSQPPFTTQSYACALHMAARMWPCKVSWLPGSAPSAAAVVRSQPQLVEAHRPQFPLTVSFPHPTRHGTSLEGTSRTALTVPAGASVPPSSSCGVRLLRTLAHGLLPADSASWDSEEAAAVLVSLSSPLGAPQFPVIYSTVSSCPSRGGMRNVDHGVWQPGFHFG